MTRTEWHISQTRCRLLLPADWGATNRVRAVAACFSQVSCARTCVMSCVRSFSLFPIFFRASGVVRPYGKLTLRISRPGSRTASRAGWTVHQSTVPLLRTPLFRARQTRFVRACRVVRPASLALVEAQARRATIVSLSRVL